MRRGAAVSCGPARVSGLATGDIAEKRATGELKFLGRKSEVIVTAAGMNIHPEDLEEAIEQERELPGCAVVPVETASGPEAYAVIAVRGAASRAAAAVAHANERLAEFQRVRRWRYGLSRICPGPRQAK